MPFCIDVRRIPQSNHRILMFQGSPMKILPYHQKGVNVEVVEYPTIWFQSLAKGLVLQTCNILQLSLPEFLNLQNILGLDHSGGKQKVPTFFGQSTRSEVSS